MPHSPAQLRQAVFEAIRSLAADPAMTVLEETPLLGEGAVLDSMKLVEVCLLLEDLSSGAGFDFDWTSEAAMSRSRGMFRNAGALADEFLRQKESAA